MKWSTSGSGIIVFIRLSEILQGAAGPRWMFFPLLDFDSAFEPLGSSFCNRHYQIKFWNSCESLLLVLLDECFSCLTLWDTFLLCSKFTFTAKDIFFSHYWPFRSCLGCLSFVHFPSFFLNFFHFSHMTQHLQTLVTQWVNLSHGYYLYKCLLRIILLCVKKE